LKAQLLPHPKNVPIAMVMFTTQCVKKFPTEITPAAQYPPAEKIKFVYLCYHQKKLSRKSRGYKEKKNTNKFRATTGCH